MVDPGRQAGKRQIQFSQAIDRFSTLAKETQAR
jgi:hypothetical protein